MLNVSLIKKREWGATYHLIYSITNKFGIQPVKGLKGLKGLSYLILSNGFQIVGNQFRFLNGSKKMQNLIRIA